MLKTMRRNVQSLKPVLWIVVATFIIAIFAVWGGAGRLGEQTGTGDLARVGSARIAGDDFTANLRQRLEAMRKEFSQLDRNLIQQLNIPQQILEQIIQQNLILQIAADRGLRVSNAEIRERIMSYPVFQKDGKFVGFAEYQQALDWNRIPVAEFEASLRKEILVTKVVRLLTAGVAVSEEEVWEAYRKANETAKIEYLVAQSEKMEAAKPTDAEIQAWFEKKKDAYRLPERRSGDSVFFKTEDLKKDVKITDGDVESYYKSNLAQFKEPETVKASRVWLPYTAADKEVVLAQARDVAKRARGGEDFAALAKTFSKDDKAKDGGDWGAFAWKSLSETERNAIQALGAGEASDIVETEGGAAVLKVTEKTPEITKSLAEVKTSIRGILEDERARELASEKAARLEKLAKREKSLDVAAQKEGLRQAATGLLKRGDALADADPSGAMSEALFGLKEKEVSAPVQTSTGVGLVSLKTIEPERPAKLEEVRSQVESELQAAAKKDKALARIRELRAKIGDKWAEEAKAAGVEFQTVNEHKREQYLGLIGENVDVDRLAFSLPLTTPSEPLAVEAGAAIVRVVERKTASREEFDKVKAQEKQTLLEAERSKFLQSILARAREEKKVKVDYDMFLRLTNDIVSRFSGE
jgi:peptidyl-prolyl cis-trans isomerase D